MDICKAPSQFYTPDVSRVPAHWGNDGGQLLASSSAFESRCPIVAAEKSLCDGISPYE